MRHNQKSIAMNKISDLTYRIEYNTIHKSIVMNATQGQKIGLYATLKKRYQIVCDINKNVYMLELW